VKTRFGKPDVEFEAGLRIHRPGSDTEAPTVQSYPTLAYTQLSKTAELHFTDYGPDRGVRLTLQGKYQRDGS